ncbi:MAG: hypothetical protein K6F50_07320 [Kiritimatiellae bacterium]|nr:hypothetical protein [Kiritimatiellia bacterium]
MEAPAPRRWCVLHVKPRTEKKMAAFLRHDRLWHHLPLVVKVKKVQRRKVRTELPLFPGYVFAKLNPSDRIAMLKTNLVVHTMSVADPRALIHELRQIEHAGRGDAADIRRAPVFREGDHVRIVYGPMRGTEGYLKRDHGGAKIVLNVMMLNQAVEISVDPGDCEKI